MKTGVNNDLQKWSDFIIKTRVFRAVASVNNYGVRCIHLGTSRILHSQH